MKNFREAMRVNVNVLISLIGHRTLTGDERRVPVAAAQVDDLGGRWHWRRQTRPRRVVPQPALAVLITSPGEQAPIGCEQGSLISTSQFPLTRQVFTGLLS